MMEYRYCCDCNQLGQTTRLDDWQGSVCDYHYNARYHPERIENTEEKEEATCQ